jgi:hypothetical protein
MRVTTRLSSIEIGGEKNLIIAELQPDSDKNKCIDSLKRAAKVRIRKF